jgi:hypothetical protein
MKEGGVGMKSSLSEGKFLLLTLSAILLLMALHIFRPQLTEFYNPADFLGIHTILEFFSIAVSAAIFLYGLKSFGMTRLGKMLYLSFIFFQIGTIDLMHTITFKGMPHFITDSSVAKATWFWVISRGLESFLMLTLIVFPNRKLKRDYRRLLLVLVAIFTSLVVFIVFHFEHSLPLLVIEGKGTTFLKNVIEYGVCFILFLSIIIMLAQYYSEKDGNKLTITIAFVFLLLSELIFTTYQSVYDFDNFTGHLFKAIGYYFILRSFYFTEPTSEIDQLSSMLSDLPGFIFKLEIRRNDCICTFCDGELLGRLGVFSKEMLSKAPQAGIFKILGHWTEEYCLSSGTTKDKKLFTINYKEKTLLISLKRYPSSEGVRSVVGTVVELQAGQQKEAIHKTRQSESIRPDKFSQFHYEQAKNLSKI